MSPRRYDASPGAGVSEQRVHAALDQRAHELQLALRRRHGGSRSRAGGRARRARARRRRSALRRRGRRHSAMIRPIAALGRPEASERASRFGRKPSARAAARTVLGRGRRDAVLAVERARGRLQAHAGLLGDVRELGAAALAHAGSSESDGCSSRDEQRVDAAGERMGDRGAAGGDRGERRVAQRVAALERDGEAGDERVARADGLTVVHRRARRSRSSRRRRRRRRRGGPRSRALRAHLPRAALARPRGPRRAGRRRRPPRLHRSLPQQRRRRLGEVRRDDVGPERQAGAQRGARGVDDAQRAGGPGELHDLPVEVVGSARRQASAGRDDALARELLEQRAEQARRGRLARAARRAR